MNAYRYSRQVGINGTDQEIVQSLVSSGVTATPIDLAALLYTLNIRGMLVKLAQPGTGGERWIGSVMNMIAAVNESGTDSEKLQLSIWFSHITNPRNASWNTTLTEHAAQFWWLFKTFAGLAGMPTPEDFAAIAALGGGWLFADLTIEQFAQQRAASELQVVKQQLIADAAARYNSYVDAVDSWDGVGNAPVL